MEFFVFVIQFEVRFEGTTSEANFARLSIYRIIRVINSCLRLFEEMILKTKKSILEYDALTFA